MRSGSTGPSCSSGRRRTGWRSTRRRPTSRSAPCPRSTRRSPADPVVDAAVLERLVEPVRPVPPFDEALEYGGIHYRVGGRDRDQVLRNVVAVLRVDIEAERDQVFEALRAREDLASTSIGEGVALPHLRNPL